MLSVRHLSIYSDEVGNSLAHIVVSASANSSGGTKAAPMCLLLGELRTWHDRLAVTELNSVMWLRNDKDKIVKIDSYGGPLRIVVPEAREAAIFGAMRSVFQAS